MAISTGMTGHLATLAVEGAAIAESTDFSLHCGQAVVDLTNRDSAYWRQLVTSTRDWSMTGTGNYFVANIGKKVLLDHWEKRDAGSIATLYIDVIFTFADGAVTATGKAFLTSLDFPSPDAGAAVFSFTLEGTDALALSAS
ncbi:MAG TPA: phage tail tube protein [Desulfatiglandales bacterium]|nr:phage tail tube protein [Desulfatiglandales bacterium]